MENGMRLRVIALCAAILFSPVLALAAAGFAPGSLWLSTTKAHAGDDITVYTAVFNSSDLPLSGQVLIRVDARELASVNISLKPGESQIVSSTWHATLGEHTFSAMLDDIQGPSEGASLTSTTATISVTAAPPTPLTQARDAVTSVLATSSPVGSAAQSVINTTESWREAGADYFNKAAAEAAATSTNVRKPTVLGASTEFKSGSSTPTQSALKQAKVGILKALATIFNVQALFYGVLLIALYLVFKLLRMLVSNGNRFNR